MEREVRDVLSALAGCVAMRCAAEKNIDDIANMERLQRAVWEIEFSSSADREGVLLPPAGVSRRRARAKSKSTPTTAAKHSSSSGSGGDRADGGGNDNNAKSIANGTGMPTNKSGERCYTTDLSSEETHHRHPSYHHHQQQRVSSLRQGSGEQKLVRVHSLGSAKFLFDSALDHRKSGLPARTRSNGSEKSTGAGGGEGEGLQSHPSTVVSDVWGTHKENASSVNNINNSGGGSSGQSGRGRWGRENAMLKACVSPLKLAEGGNELPGAVAMATSSTPPAAAFALLDTPRYSPTPASHRDTLDGGRRKVSPTISKKPLCGSTWLGPEVSPLPNDQDPRLTRAVNFEASPWSSPRRTSKLRRGRKVISCRGGEKRGNGIGKEGELELERDMKLHRGRRGDQQRIASIGEAGSTPSGQQAVDIQAFQGELQGREGGESRFGSSMSFNLGRKRNHTGDNSTAGHDYSEEHGGATWDCSGRANGSSSASLWQEEEEEEACPDRVSSSSCPPLAHGGTAHFCEQRRGDGLMQEIISETSPKAPSHQAETGGAGSRPDFRVEPMPEIYCFQQDQLRVETPDSSRDTGNARNAPMRNETSHENEAEFGAEWSPRAYYQSDDPGEDNHTAGVDEDEQTETNTSDEDEEVDGTRSNPLIFSIPTLPQPQPRDGVVGGGGGGRNEAGDDIPTTSRSSAAEGTPRVVLGPSSDNIGGHRLGGGAELEVVQVRQTEINGGAFEVAGGVEASAASSTTTMTTPFRCRAHDADKSVFVERDRRSVGRQQQPHNTQHNNHQQKHRHRQHHRLSVESPKHPLGQPQHHHQHQRQRRRQHPQPQPLWQQPQRRVSVGDQVDRSGGNLMQEKLTTLLTKRLKQLAQLEALTIQWERLPRREQEKLDRQQRLMSSRFRLTEQARWDSGVSLSTVPPVSGPAVAAATAAAAAAVNHSPTALAAATAAAGVSVSHRTTPSTGGSGRVTNAGYILPPSDASISASVDLPCYSPGARDGSDTTAGRAYFSNGASAGEGFRGSSLFTVSGRGAARHPRITNAGAVTPRGQRKRREAFGRGERGCRGGGGGGDGEACGVRDADTASGRARRWRVGNPALRIVGVKTSIDDK